MKRFLLLFSAIILSITVLFAYDVEIDGMYYNLDESNRTAEVTNGTDRYSGDVTIPETITYNSKTYSVTSINKEALDYCYELISVTIPSNIITIDDGAFICCKKLKEIIVDSDNSKFISIDGVLFNKDKTQLVRYPVGKNSTSYEIPESVNTIGYGAFCYSSNLTLITIPNSVVSIGDWAFSDCTGLTKVNYLGTVEEWNNIDFKNDYSTPTRVTEDLYINDVLLTDVKIRSVDSIKQYAFYRCKNIKSVEIDNRVTSIGDDAFSGTGITRVNYLGTVDEWAEIDFGSRGANPTYYANDLYINGDLLTDVKITSADSIKNYAFYNCKSIKSVEIDNRVTSIGDDAFSGTGITRVNYLGPVDEWAKIDLHDNPTYYANDLYINGDLLTDVKITSADSIKNYAFYNCKSIKSVEIGNNVKFIGYGAFGGCDSLTKVNYLGTIDEWVKIDFEGSTSNPTCYAKDLYINDELLTDVKITSADSIKQYAFYNCKSIKSVEIGNSVTSIGGDAFSGCSGLNSVLIGNSVTSIGDYAFYNCSGLTSVEIGNSVTSIGREAFKYCSALTSVAIPSDVTSIGHEAFSFCSGLTSITIPNSVVSIREFAFSECSGLTKVNYLGTADEWAEIDFRSILSNPTYYANDLYINGELLTDVKITSADSIKQYAFYNCKSIKSVEIGNSVTLIGDKAFYNCSGLMSVTIGNSVTSIGDYAFYNCYGLTSATIGDSVTSIESYAFSGCSNLTSIVIPKNVKSIRYNVFKYCKNLKSIYNCSGVDILVDLETPPILESPGEGKTTLALYIPKSACEEALPYAIGQMPGDGSWKNQESLKMTRCEGKSRWWQVTVDALTPENATNFKFRMDDGYGGWSFEPKGGRYELLEDAAEYIQIKPDETNNLLAVANCNNKVLYIESRDWSTPCQSDERYFIMSEVINGCPVGDFIVNYEDEIIKYIGDTTVNKIEIPESVKGIDEGVFASCANIDTIVWNSINCADFTETTSPFKSLAPQIKSVIFGNDVEYIPAYLCSDMTLLTEVSIPSKVNSIGENTFKGCSRLKFITSYPTLVPLAKENSFNSYSAYLYIPCDYYDYYYLDDVFGKFTEIKCISAEEVEGSYKVEIEVDSNNNATIIWPSTGNASSYELIISKNGEVFCTLLFNENGQLTSIDFGNRSSSVGFQFTVTGLDGASKYSYSIVAKDEKGHELESYNGTFTTNGYVPDSGSDENPEDMPTSVNESLADANITVSGGAISADAEFSIYNTVGQDVTALNGSLTPGVYVVQVGEDIEKVMVK